MRELFKALSDLENQLIALYGVSLNEAMALCSIGSEMLSASEISEMTGLAPSHTSKVIKSVEDKGFIKRNLGKKDKRQMYFKLTEKGNDCLLKIKEEGIDIPEFLKVLFE